MTYQELVVEQIRTAPAPWNRENLTVDELAVIDHLTRKWHGSLPVFEGPNRRLPVVQAVLHGENAEALAEREQEGTAAFNPRAAQKESLDIAVPVHAFAMRRGFEIDLQEIRRRMDGYGKTSHIYDYIKEIIGNLPESQALEKELQWLLTQVYSMMWHLPEINSPAEIVKPKMKENKRNYPEMYYTLIHPETGKILTPEEQELRYIHSNRCMRLVRRTFNRTNGLYWTDHVPHAPLILDFLHAERNYQALVEAMEQIKKLPLAV